MGRRNDHTREELRALIVAEARRLVARDGVERVGARRLAEAIGYTPGTLYTAFGNLDAVFLHVNALGVGALHAACAAARDAAHGAASGTARGAGASAKGDPAGAADAPVRALLAMGLAYVGYARDHEHEFRLMFRPRSDPPPPDAPALAPRIGALFALVDEELRALAPDAAPAERATAARALWSGVHGVAALGLTDQLYPAHDEGAEAVVATLVQRFAAGWRA